MSSFWAETKVYASHVVALFVPGRPVRAHDVLRDEHEQVGFLGSWDDGELDLLIAESRRALDGQHDRMKDVRTTAQVLLPLSIALLVASGSRLGTIAAIADDVPRRAGYAVWGVGCALVAAAALGAGAILSVRSTFGSIYPPALSQCDRPIRPELAEAYARQIPTGETTVGTRVTVIRDAVALLVIGGAFQLGLWIWVTVSG